jgi:AcrR family transcriptional regulator
MPAASSTSIPANKASPDARILEQARVRLLGYGYAAFTMDALAGDLGMSKKTLYVHFQGKDAIIRAAMDDVGIALRHEADKILAQPRVTFAEKLRGLAETIVEKISRLRPEFIQELNRSAPHLHRHMQQLRGETISYVFGRFIEEGQLAGAIHDDINPVFAGEYYMHAMQGMMHGDTLRRLRLSPAETFEQAIRLFFGGLLTSHGKLEYEKSFPR